MRIEELTEQYVYEYVKYIDGEGKFDANDFLNLMEELDGNREIKLEDLGMNIQFSNGYKLSEDGPEHNYELNEKEKAEMLIDIYKNLDNEKLREEYLSTMLENTATLPYDATVFFEKIDKEKKEEVEIEEELPEEEMVIGSGSATSSSSGEETIEVTEKKETKEEKTEITLQYNVDGPAIAKYKADTEELKEELEYLKGLETTPTEEVVTNEEITFRNPFEDIENELAGLDGNIAALTEDLENSKDKPALLEQIVIGLNNFGLNDTLIPSATVDQNMFDEEYANIREKVAELPQIDIELEKLHDIDTLANHFKRIVNKINNDNEINYSAIQAVVAKISNMRKKYANDNIIMPILAKAEEKITGIINVITKETAKQKVLTNEDKNEIINKAENASNEIEAYRARIVQTNKQSEKAVWNQFIDRSKQIEIQKARGTVRKANEEVLDDLVNIYREFLKMPEIKKYHEYSDEQIDIMESSIQIQNIGDNIIRGILKEENGQLKLQNIVDNLKYRIDLENERIANLNNDITNAETRKTELLSVREQVAQIMQAIENLNPTELTEEIITDLKNKIESLNAPEKTKEALRYNLEIKITSTKTVGTSTEIPEDIKERIAELEGIIKSREGNIALYYECLKEIEALEKRLEEGLKFEGSRYNKQLAIIKEKMKPLPPELQNELNLYISRHKKYEKGHWKRKIKVIAKKTLKWMKEHKLATIGLGLALGTVVLYATMPGVQMMINSCLWNVGKSLGWSSGTLNSLHNTNLGLSTVVGGGKYAFEAGTGLYTLGGKVGAAPLYTKGTANLVSTLMGLGAIGGTAGIIATVKDRIQNWKNRKKPEVVETKTEVTVEEEVKEDKKVEKEETVVKTKSEDFTPEQKEKIELMIQEVIKQTQIDMINKLVSAGLTQEQIAEMLTAQPKKQDEPEVEPAGKTM